MQKSVRLVADTNVVLSALLWGGPPLRLIETAKGAETTLWTSVPLLAELKGVLGRSKFAARIHRIGSTPDQLLRRYLDIVNVVRSARIAPVIARDPADDQVLAAALASNAGLIVSGDAHLLDLESWRGICVVRVSDALKIVAANQAQRLA